MKKCSRIISIAVMLVLILCAGCSPSALETTQPEEKRNETTDSRANTEQTESTDGKTESSEPPATEPPQTEITQAETEISQPNDEIERRLTEMTLKEKVGQLFIIRPDALDFSPGAGQSRDPSAAGMTELSSSAAEALKNYPVGGFVFFRKNIQTPQQITDFIASIQGAGELPFFITLDEEGGSVARIANNDAFNVRKYTSAAAVGATGDTAQAEEMGSTIGAYLSRYGFNMDFAPVADVYSNPDNTVIGSRAFSSNAKTAASMAEAMAKGLKQQNIIPTFKHFPGHGDTAEDSHKEIAVNRKSKAEMEKCEWLPYKSLSNDECVMVGHIAAPGITGDMTPASMSYKIVSGILRQQLNFNGVVITDSLEMGAVTESYTSAEAAVNAVNAGCDILLCPDDFRAAFDAVIKAVEDGKVSEERINESVYRIILLKQTYGLL